MRLKDKPRKEHNLAAFLVVVLILTCVVLTWSGWQTYQSFNNSKKESERLMQIVKLRGSIVHLDEVLTMSAQMAVVTGDLQWEQRYQRFEPLLDAAIKEVLVLTSDDDAVEAAVRTDAANIVLVEMENHAFDLVREGYTEEATAILFGDGYVKQKRIYTQGMTQFTDAISNSINAKWLHEQRRTLFHTLRGILLLPFLIIAWLIVYRTVNKWRRMLLASNSRLARKSEELINLNLTLDKRVSDRTNELSEINKSLKTEIIERKQLELIKSGQQNILELISNSNSSLAKIFTAIIDLAEKQYPSVRATILYVNDNKLHYAAAPSMPDAYNELIDGLEIGPCVGSCGTSAYRKERVIVSDVAMDPLWADYRQLGEKYDFHACWSEPVFNANRDVIATFALYHENPRVPGYAEIQLIEAMSNLVSIAIERKQADEKITFQASHDALTDLVNRYEFERRAERLLSTIKQGEDEHALCFMDLDQFKIVNDTCGHMAGDEMLRQLSTVLQNEVRKRDTLARLGGDEFAVLMEHCSLEQAHRVATSLLKAVRNFRFIWEGNSFKVGVSIGLVAIIESTPNLTELLKNADAACYMAKDKGRNRIHVHQAEDAEIAQRHGEMQWVTRIHQAMEENRFCLYAQPIVPLNNSTDIHYELLIRMRDVKGKIIPPSAFLPAAERYNLMEQLDRWVIEYAFILLAEHPAFLKQIHFISINLSGQSLADESFRNFVIKLIHDSGIEGEKICFEITETAAISNLSKAISFISALKGLGCRFALDDFGSGFSSFAYLKNLTVDYLKIDGMFVKDIVNDPIDHAMVKSINEIGQVMCMQTIAEFVENDEIKNMLREIGVNYAQGYGIEKPMPFDELLGRSNERD